MREKAIKRGLLFVISGPSGSGKTTLAKQLLQDKTLKGKLSKSISFTTRPKRSGERQKRDYLFISEAQFKRSLKSKKILEWTKYLGYYYGTPKDFVDAKIKAGKHLLFCVDLKGIANFKRIYPQESVTIFIMPPSLGELRRRIEKRCSKTKKEEIARRMKLAEKEILVGSKFDFCLINKDLDKSEKLLRNIVLSRVNNS